MSDLTVQLVDIARKAAIAAGATINASAEEIVDGWRQQDVLSEAEKLTRTVFLQPRGANYYDTVTQRHAVVILEETEMEFIVAAKWPGCIDPIHYPKHAWELCQ